VIDDHELGLRQRPRQEVTDIGKLGAAQADDHSSPLLHHDYIDDH
jgi:hypothetical protein